MLQMSLDLSPYIQKYKKNELVFEEGDRPSCFYFILKGGVELVRLHSNGSSVERRIEAGMTFGELSYFTQESFSTQARANEGCDLLKISEANLDAFIQDYPEVIFNIMTKLSTLLAKTNEQFEMIQVQGRNGEGNKDVGHLEIVSQERHYAIEGHKRYPMLLPEGHEAYLYDKEIQCPVCDTEFSVSQIRGSKLVFSKTDRDQRKHFKGFDELWYQLWRCPTCGYVNFHNEFFKIRSEAKKQLFENLPRVAVKKEQVLIKNDINQVLEDYLHFSKLIQFYQVDPIVNVRLWQSIAWILEDVKDIEAAFKARRILKLLMEDSWYSSRVVTQPEDQCKLTIKLASLCKEEGDFTAARKYLLSLSKVKDMPSALRLIIQDELLELKDMVKAEVKK